MAASNSTPIQLYYSNTPGSAPTNTNLIIGELAINVPDGIIFYKDASNNVNVIARTSAAAGQFANVTFGDGSIQYKSAAPWAYTNSIHGLANTAITDIIYLQGVNATQNTVLSNAQSYANGAFTKANAAADRANTIYDNYAYPAYVSTQNQVGVDATQNTTITNVASVANGAFTKANTTATDITNLQGVNLTQNTSIQSATDIATSGFNKANTAAIDITNIQGVNLTQNTSIQSATDIATGAFVQANTSATDITYLQGVNATQNNTTQRSWDRANAAFDYANTIIATGGSVDGQAREYANGAFVQANTNAIAITNLQAVDATQNTLITNVNSYANGAFTKANNAVANTSDITVANNITVPGQANVYNRLSVGTGAYTLLPNLIAQFTGSSDLYSQINQQNLRANGSGDIVITADNGTDVSNFIDMGLAGSTYDNTTFNAYPFSQPNDGWLFLVGNTAANFGGNLTIGTAGSGSFADISFVQGDTYDEVARFKNGANVEFYRPVVANSFVTSSGIDVVTYTNTANTYLKNIIDTKVSKSGDSITGSLSIDGSASANALSVTGNVYISNDLRISGNLYIGGNATSVSANNLTLDDSIIYIANNNPSNVIDIGIVGAFDDGTYQHTGFVRDATDGKWKLFSNVIAEPTTTVNFTNADYDTLKLGSVETDSIIVSGLNIAAHTNVAFNKANTAYDSANSKISNVFGTSGRVTATGTSNVTVDLVTTGVTGGTYSYPLLQVDAYGRVVTISNQTPVSSFNSRTGAVTLGSGDVTGALGYTPVDSVSYSNDLGTQAGIDSSQNTRIIAVGSYANGAFSKANAASVYANGAFTQANSTNELVLGSFETANNAGNFANGSFTLANTTSAVVTLAYNKANNSGQFANGAFATANSATTLATNAGDFANGAFTQANTLTTLGTNAGNFANGAFGQANTATTLATNAGNFANGAFEMANNAFNTGGVQVGTYANGAFAAANSATALATNVGTFANGAFVTANAAFTKANNVGDFANGAFTQGNSAYTLANNAYNLGLDVGNYANGAFVQANSSFNHANSAYSLAYSSFYTSNIAFDAANTNATSITFVGTYANGAFTKANAVGSYANSAYNHANNSSQYANGAFTVANIAFDKANTGYDLAVGAFTQANTTNTLATNAGDFANGSFSRGNSAFEQSNTVYGWANTIYSNYASPAYQNTLDLAGVNLTQNTNISLVGSFANGAFTQANSGYNLAANAAVYANGAFDLANTTATTLALEQSYTNSVYTLANTNATAITNLQGVDASQNTLINFVLSHANSAFGAANSEVIGTGAFSRANASYETANTNAAAITNLQGVNTWQNTYSQEIHSTSNGAFVKANSAWTLANDAYAYANTLVTGGTSIDGWARGHANSAYDTANGSFVAANTSLSYALSSFQKANSIVSPTYTTSDTPPNNPSTSAIWYNTTNDVMYQWVTGDGTNYYWIDIGSPTVTVGNTVISYTYTGYGRAAAHAMIFGGF